LGALDNPSSVLERLVGELKTEGSTFSASSASNDVDARDRLPTDEALFNGVEAKGEIAF
jgi:hypothetical protein